MPFLKIKVMQPVGIHVRKNKPLGWIPDLTLMEGIQILSWHCFSMVTFLSHSPVWNFLFKAQRSYFAMFLHGVFVDVAHSCRGITIAAVSWRILCLCSWISEQPCLGWIRACFARWISKNNWICVICHEMKRFCISLKWIITLTLLWKLSELHEKRNCARWVCFRNMG